MRSAETQTSGQWPVAPYDCHDCARKLFSVVRDVCRANSCEDLVNHFAINIQQGKSASWLETMSSAKDDMSARLVSFHDYCYYYYYHSHIAH